MKRVFSIFMSIAVMLGVISFSGCAKGETFVSSDYEISAVNGQNGINISVRKGETEVLTESGAIGVRFDKNSFRADDPVYAGYSKVEKTENGLIASGTVQSEYGSEISFVDCFSVDGRGVRTDRTFTVLKQGEDKGFTTELKWVKQASGKIVDSEWFIPSTYYVNGEHGFDKSSGRMFFSGSEAVIPAEDVSMLSVSEYKDHRSLTLSDATAGFRENIVEDNDSNNTCLYVDEKINVPGIVLGETDEKISFSHVYPSHRNRVQDVVCWRMLPVREGLTRTVSSYITVGSEESYGGMLRNIWRNGYDVYDYADKRYSVDTVYETLIDLIDRSYAAINIWGAIPMYMTNTDHFIPDSGFLYRNLEFATLMLKEGRERENQKMIDDALSVIHDQIASDRLDTGITAYPMENSVYKRVLFEGLRAAVDLWLYEKSYQKENTEFLDELLDYIVDKGEKYKDERSAMALLFYMPLYEHGEELYVDYKDTALAILEKAYEDSRDYSGYFGAIESTNPFLSVAEDYMILLNAFITAYETDGQQKWLDKSIEIADFLETFQMIQPFKMNLEGAVGNDGYYHGFIGNERFLGHGYIFNNTQHGILDIANTASVIDYYKLYKHTQDEHYLRYAENKLHNSLLYINMGDKVGYMDDLLHSAGKGFMNEFAGNSTFSSGYSEAGVRGAVHDSNLGWNVWQIASVFRWFKEQCGTILPREMSAETEYNLARNKYVYGESNDAFHSAVRATDGDPTTYFMPSAENDALILDLNEFCNLKRVAVVSASENPSVQVAFSTDGVRFGAETELVFDKKEGEVSVNCTARYVWFTSDAGIAEVSVSGSPCFYETLNYGAKLENGDETVKYCIDESDYTTSWNAKSDQPQSFVLDLQSECEIFQTALKLEGIVGCKYKIELSSDNNSYRLYAEHTDLSERLVFVDEGYAKARYVRLTLLETTDSQFVLNDFKVMGQKIQIS